MGWEKRAIESIEKANKWMESHDERLVKIERCLIKQEYNLREHMRRTELAEKSIADLHVCLTPLKVHVYHVEGALKLLGLTSLLITIGAAVYGLFF